MRTHLHDSSVCRIIVAGEPSVVNRLLTCPPKMRRQFRCPKILSSSSLGGNICRWSFTQKYPKIIETSDTRTTFSNPRKPHNIWGANRPEGSTRPLCPAEEEEKRERASESERGRPRSAPREEQSFPQPLARPSGGCGA